MIKKVFNWSFGAFFRTIGRILAYFLIGLLLLIIGSKLGFNLGYIKVDALTLTNWSESLPSLPRTQLYDCNTSNVCTAIGLSNESITTNNGNREFATATQSVTIASGGIAIQTNSNVLKPGYLYLTNYYICANKSLDSAVPEIYNTVYDSPGIKKTSYNNASYYSLGNIPGDGSHVFNSCKQYSGLYVPTEENNWTTLRLKSSSSISGVYISILGYENKELGIYSDTIKTIVEQANGNVKQAVDEVKEETKKTNDTITDTSSPDTEDSINEWSEKMIDNPLEAVVMLPLTILNSIKNSLSGTCSALNVPVPFINENINIPCISTIFAQIEGVTEFWNSIGTIVSALMLYQYLIYLYNWIDDTISLKTKRMHGWGSV